MRRPVATPDVLFGPGDISLMDTRRACDLRMPPEERLTGKVDSFMPTAVDALAELAGLLLAVPRPARLRSAAEDLAPFFRTDVAPPCGAEA